MLTTRLSELARNSYSLLVLADHQDLKKLGMSLSSILSVHAVQLRIPGLPAEEQSSWQSRIDKHLEACGCGQGLIGTVFFLGIYCVYRSIDPLEQSWGGWWTIGAGFGTAIAGAALGKTWGLLRARLQLRKTLRALELSLGPDSCISTRRISRY
jgi:hypothetical protein